METILRIVKEEGNTVIFVTYRKSAVQLADKIVEMKDCRIIPHPERMTAPS